MRDALEQADHDLWAAIPADDDTDAAAKRCAGRSLSTGGGAATKASWQELRQKAGRRASCAAPRLFHLHGDPDRRKLFSGPGFEAERRASVPPAWPKDVDYEGVGARRAERRGACDPDGDHRDGRPVRARSAISRKITSSSMRKSRSSASLNATIRTRRGNFKRGRDRALKLVRREWASAAAPRSDAQRGIAGSTTRGPAAPQRRSGETSRRASRTIRPFSIRITRSAQSK